MNYTEDTLVQQTTADYLEQQLRWRSVYAYNNEDFGPGSLLGRGSDREVVLECTLREKLAALNPGLPVSAYDEAVRQITATVASQTLAATNREKYELMRDGVQVTFRNDRGERDRQRLRLFDFDEPDNNDFLCVRELWVRGDLYRRRADIIGFVNGLPLLFIECKNLHKNLRAAFEQNYSDYRDTIPHLFHHNAIVMFGNGEQAKIGSITSRWEHFNEWKRLAEDAPGEVDMATLLKGVCDKRNFLDLVENFILFDESAGEPKKIIARNHQFLGVNRAIASVKDRKTRLGKLGVFWHTQGSGKSYSMVMFTRKVHRKLGGNFTFLVLTDRDDLDTQIYKTFAGCGVVSEKYECRAASGHHLNVLLTQHKAYIFSLSRARCSVSTFLPTTSNGRSTTMPRCRCITMPAARSWAWPSVTSTSASPRSWKSWRPTTLMRSRGWSGSSSTIITSSPLMGDREGDAGVHRQGHLRAHA